MPDVRSAVATDVAAVIALWEVAAGPTRLASDIDAVRALIARDPDALLVVEHDGRIVGTLIVGWDGWRCHLYRMAVAPAHRRDGVASLLVEEAGRRARALGARRLDAMVADENDGGTSFWAAHGFEIDLEDHRWSRMTTL